MLSDHVVVTVIQLFPEMEIDSFLYTSSQYSCLIIREMVLPVNVITKMCIPTTETKHQVEG